MIRGTLVAFVAGWALWLWLDKNPVLLGPVPYPRDGDFLHNFQVTVDLVKQARMKAAFIYVWKAHYLVLSLAIGLLLGMVGNSISRVRARRRFAELYLPGKKETVAKEAEDERQ